MKTLIIVAALLALSGTANADSYYKGGGLLKDCETRYESAGWSSCSGYLLAVAEITALFPSSGICVPEEPWKRNLPDVFMQYAKAHPEKWAGDAKHLVMDAFKHAFPCE